MCNEVLGNRIQNRDVPSAFLIYAEKRMNRNEVDNIMETCKWFIDFLLVSTVMQIPNTLKLLSTK